MDSSLGGFILGLVILILVIIILVIIFAVFFVASNGINSIKDSLTQILDFFSSERNLDLCQRAEIIEIPGQFEAIEKGVYSRQNARMCLALSINTTAALCGGQDPPVPEGFEEAIPLKVGGPGGRISYPIGYWYFRPRNVRERQEGIGIFVFGSNIDLGKFLEYATLEQMPPTEINGYVNGMEINRQMYLLYRIVRPFLRLQWARSFLQVDKLLITGHGVGAGLAGIAALDFNEQLAGHYSFSAPNIGNPIFSQEFARLINSSYRVVNSADWLPGLPPVLIRGYRYLQADSQTISFNRNLGSALENNLQAYLDEFMLVPMTV